MRHRGRRRQEALQEQEHHEMPGARLARAVRPRARGARGGVADADADVRGRGPRRRQVRLHGRLHAGPRGLQGPQDPTQLARAGAARREEERRHLRTYRTRGAVVAQPCDRIRSVSRRRLAPGQAAQRAPHRVEPRAGPGHQGQEPPIQRGLERPAVHARRRAETQIFNLWTGDHLSERLSTRGRDFGFQSNLQH